MRGWHRAPTLIDYSTVRFVVEYDPDPDLSWVTEWDTPERYATNEVYEDGKPVPWEEYRRTYGNPAAYVSLWIQCQVRCPCCGEWREGASVGGCDYLYTDDYPAPDSDYTLEEAEQHEGLHDYAHELLWETRGHDPSNSCPKGEG